MGLIKGKLFNKGNQFLPQAQLIGIDTNNKLLSGGSVNYTATEDCILVAYIYELDSGGLKIDNVSLVHVGGNYYKQTYAYIPIKKGQKVSGGGTAPNYVIYGLKH